MRLSEFVLNGDILDRPINFVLWRGRERYMVLSPSAPVSFHKRTRAVIVGYVCESQSCSIFALSDDARLKRDHGRDGG